MYYIIDQYGKVVGTIHGGSPNLEDLKSRKEFIVEHAEEIPPHLAVFKNNKISQRELTSEEIEGQKKSKKI